MEKLENDPAFQEALRKTLEKLLERADALQETPNTSTRRLDQSAQESGTNDD